MILMVFWTVTVLFIIPWKRAELRSSDGACVLSLRLWTLFPPLAMDCIANLYLSIAFIMPVSRSRSAEARRLAHVSTVATLAALLVTLGNAITLAVLHGRERMFVCLGTCTLDVTGNAVIIYVVTIPRREAAPSPSGAFQRAGPTLPGFQRGGNDGAGEMRQNTKHAIPATRRSWSWRRSSSSRSGQVDLSSISVQVCHEVVVEDGGEIDGDASRREYTLPKPPDACAGAGGAAAGRGAGGSPRPFVHVRPAASSSEASEGSRPLSETMSDVESCSDGLIKACRD
ncbi:hypothetical protein JCM10908_003149 [Rhodotorula pacifica]|uniref:uncharacterized protein n=1 Tax=Rhodotorula pacifica TaxID=1495444 RepID=UPI00316EFFEE